MILMIDNYDSFTYNIVQYLGELGSNVKVVRNDMISIQDIEYMEPEKIVISPGPCTPKEAGVSIETINHFHKNSEHLTKTYLNLTDYYYTIFSNIYFLK